MSVQRIYLVRHGETDYNVSGRWQGDLDIPLNRVGKEQAKLVGEVFLTLSIGAMYSSDLSRAYETAQTIAKTIGYAHIYTDQRLRELNLGIFQGLTRQEIMETYPLEHTYWQNDDNYAVPKGGESRIQVQKRIHAFWQEMTTKETAENVVVVSHGGTIRWLLNRVFAPDMLIGKHFENTSITTVECHDGVWTLGRVGDISHLDNRPVVGDKKWNNTF
jgi:broad specificity phosphatase PhoE